MQRKFDTMKANMPVVCREQPAKPLLVHSPWNSRYRRTGAHHLFCSPLAKPSRSISHHISGILLFVLPQPSLVQYRTTLLHMLQRKSHNAQQKHHSNLTQLPYPHRYLFPAFHTQK